MPKLFENDLVYPRDQYGSYVALQGTIVGVVGTLDEGCNFFEVQTEYGTFQAVWDHHPPSVGCGATIHVYDSGGGHYPDNRIVSWSRPPVIKGKPLLHRLLEDD